MEAVAVKKCKIQYHTHENVQSVIIKYIIL